MVSGLQQRAFPGLFYQFGVDAYHAVAALNAGLARGNPRRRLLLGSKGRLDVTVAVHGWPTNVGAGDEIVTKTTDRCHLISGRAGYASVDMLRVLGARSVRQRLIAIAGERRWDYRRVIAAEDIETLLFDVLGTVVDEAGSMRAELAAPRRRCSSTVGHLRPHNPRPGCASRSAQPGLTT